MAYKMSPSTKLVVSIIVIFAIIIPLLLAYVLIFPLGLSPTRTVATSSTSGGSSSSVSGQTQVIIPNGIGVTPTGALNFQPSSLTVAPGTTIVWVDQDTSTHNIHFLTMPTGATISPNPSPNTPQWTNGMYSVTLTVPGTYTYVCDYHSWMKGTIVVS